MSLVQIKIQNRKNLLKCLLLLSGDIVPNPGPIQVKENNVTPKNIYQTFKNCGMLFLHLNIPS